MYTCNTYFYIIIKGKYCANLPEIKIIQMKPTFFQLRTWKKCKLKTNDHTEDVYSVT